MIEFCLFVITGIVSLITDNTMSTAQKTSLFHTTKTKIPLQFPKVQCASVDNDGIIKRNQEHDFVSSL